MTTEQMERVARVIEGIADMIDKVTVLVATGLIREPSIAIHNALVASWTEMVQAEAARELRLAAGLIREQPAEVARLRALLADLEWVGDGMVSFCPDCYGWSPDHKIDCRLKAALDGR